MLNLPERRGPKPAISEGIPQQQVDQTPPPELYAQMAERFLDAPDTLVGPSLISVPGARALFLEEGCACNRDAFMRGREFAHIHPAYDGSFHMLLSTEDCEQVLTKGWGQLHPYALSGKIQPTTALIYAPRDEREMEVILAIAAASRRFAMTPLPEEGER